MNNTVKCLIKQVKQGDQLAFGKLIELYQHKVYRICFRLIGNCHGAEDLAQEVFLQAYQNINNHDTNKKFSSWLFRIAIQLTMDRLKKTIPDYYLDTEIDDAKGMTRYTWSPANNKLLDNQVIGLELQDTVQKETFQLAPEYRSVIVLKYMEGLSLREISEIMQIPIGTVKTSVHRGREILRKQLEQIL